ncbi:hypothetical protein [Winogradskyella ursingii]|uniref:hypothetical protein n=1 Tax=Winogradskyella ursingii TaxID=2686079 RepID=UPI0015C7CA35|nr:hypothetical protein [Winogradskyella ursingii]
MKKLILLFVAALTLSVSAQEKIKEGVITTKQTISSDNEQMNEAYAQMGDMIGTTYFKESKSRSELSNPMTGDITAISHTTPKKTETLTLMDTPAMGKVYMTQTVELTEELMNSVSVEKGERTKTILGYECKEHIVTITQNGVDMKMILFTTDKIEPALNQQTAVLGNKIKGYPMYMEMEMDQQGMKMNIITEVTDLKKQPVDDAKFNMTPPDGYKEMPGM